MLMYGYFSTISRRFCISWAKLLCHTSRIRLWFLPLPAPPPPRRKESLDCGCGCIGACAKLIIAALLASPVPPAAPSAPPAPKPEARPLVLPTPAKGLSELCWLTWEKLGCALKEGGGRPAEPGGWCWFEWCGRWDCERCENGPPRPCGPNRPPAGISQCCVFHVWLKILTLESFHR